MSELPLKLISDKHLEAIGCVSVQWSLLELVIEDCILDAASLPQPHFGRNLTAHMGVTQRLDSLLSLVNARLANTTLEKQVLDINKRIRRSFEGNPSLQTQRNRVIHSYWEQGTESDVAVALSFRAYSKLKINFMHMRPEDILGTADQIRLVVQDLGDWQDRLQTKLAKMEPPPS